MSTAALAKTSMKARIRHKKKDLTKLREDLRQRCKQRMREQREELLNQRRFGVSTNHDVEERLKEIFHGELDELATKEDYDVPEERAELIKKHIDNENPDQSLTEEEKLIVEDFHKLKEETSTLLKEES